MARKVRETTSDGDAKPSALAPFSSRSLSIRNWLLLGRFEPARAQRDYQWTEPQWKELLYDLLNVFGYAGLDPMPPETADAGDDSAKPDRREPIAQGKKPVGVLQVQKVSHFYLGHVILFRERKDETFHIYDGQQRLTTLTLLLCALRDAPESGKQRKTIDDLLRTSDKLARLTVPAGRSTNALALVLNDGAAADQGGHNVSTSPAGHRILQAAQYFRRETASWDAKRLSAFAKFILEDVFVTVTFLVDRRVAEYAYITTNTRGKALENADIIKGHFAQLASLSSPAEANRIAEAWNRLEKGGARRLERLLRAAFLIDFRCAPNFDFGTQLMDFFSDQASLPQALHWVEVRLPELMAIEKKSITDPLQRDVLSGPEANIRKLGFLPWRHWQAIFYRLMERDKNAPKRFATAMQSLERWAFAVNLLGWEEQNIASAVLKALDQIDNDTDPFASRNRLALTVTQKNAVRSRLKEGQLRNDETRGAHVRWLETLYWPANSVNFAATQDSSVEHVLPQRPDGQWRTDFGEKPAYYTECLGNLCLIPKEVNKRIGNAQYAEKRPQLKGLSQHFKSAREVAQEQRWTPQVIEKRNERLNKLASEALGLGAE